MLETPDVKIARALSFVVFSNLLPFLFITNIDFSGAKATVDGE